MGDIDRYLKQKKEAAQKAAELEQARKNAERQERLSEAQARLKIAEEVFKKAHIPSLLAEISITRWHAGSIVMNSQGSIKSSFETYAYERFNIVYPSALLYFEYEKKRKVYKKESSGRYVSPGDPPDSGYSYKEIGETLQRYYYVLGITLTQATGTSANQGLIKFTSGFSPSHTGNLNDFHNFTIDSRRTVSVNNNPRIDAIETLAHFAQVQSPTDWIPTFKPPDIV